MVLAGGRRRRPADRDPPADAGHSQARHVSDHPVPRGDEALGVEPADAFRTGRCSSSASPSSLLAVAALAGPILVTPAREAAWRDAGGTSGRAEDRTAAPEDELRSAAVARTFARLRLRDAVADARPVARNSRTPSAGRSSSCRRSGGAPAMRRISRPCPGTSAIRLVRTSDGSADARARDLAAASGAKAVRCGSSSGSRLTPSATEVREIEAARLTSCRYA